MSADRRPLPVPTPDSEEFWAGCADETLRMQRCRSCDELNWFPRGMCVNCSRDNLEWITLTGRGTVYSFSIVSRPPNESFPPRYVLALVDLEEGPRMLTHLVDIEPEAITIGLPVAVSFERRSDEISLPVFRATA
jgi:uncharacterized OB-fold protein